MLIAEMHVAGARYRTTNTMRKKMPRDTGNQAVIGHQQLSDAVELYGVFLHT